MYERRRRSIRFLFLSGGYLCTFFIGCPRRRRRLRHSIINRETFEPTNPRLDESKLTAHYSVAFLFINAQRELSSMVL